MKTDISRYKIALEALKDNDNFSQIFDRFYNLMRNYSSWKDALEEMSRQDKIEGMDYEQVSARTEKALDLLVDGAREVNKALNLLNEQTIPVERTDISDLAIQFKQKGPRFVDPIGNF